jgi:hypothetical protein
MRDSNTQAYRKHSRPIQWTNGRVRIVVALKMSIVNFRSHQHGLKCSSDIVFGNHHCYIITNLREHEAIVFAVTDRDPQEHVRGENQSHQTERLK